MKKVILKVLKIVGFSLGVIIILLICLFIFLGIDDNHHKKLIENELNRIGAPAGCVEKERQYQASGIDTVSEWDVTYDCSSTNAQVYNSVAGKLKPLGYKIIVDSINGGPYLFFDIVYKSNKYTVEYSDNYHNVQSFKLDQKNQLDTQVTPILSMTIQEN